MNTKNTASSQEVVVNDKKLIFEAPSQEKQRFTFSLKNNSDKHVAFKVKSTQERLKCNPHYGVMPPYGHLTLSLKMKPLLEMPSSNDRFTVVLAPATSDTDAKRFWEHTKEGERMVVPIHCKRPQVQQQLVTLVESAPNIYIVNLTMNAKTPRETESSEREDLELEYEADDEREETGGEEERIKKSNAEKGVVVDDYTDKGQIGKAEESIEPIEQHKEDRPESTEQKKEATSSEKMDQENAYEENQTKDDKEMIEIEQKHEGFTSEQHKKEDEPRSQEQKKDD